MSIQWNETEEEIIDILNSNNFKTEGGQWNKWLLKWGNRTVRDVAREIDIRQHLRLSCTRTFTTAEWQVALDDDFFKISDRFTRARVGEDYIDIIPLETLISYDPDHDQTTDNDQPDYVAVEGRRIHVFPMFAGDLVLENFFRIPTPMADRTGFPDLPDDEDVQDLLIAGVLRRGFRMLGDFDMQKNYEADYIYYLDIYRRHLDRSNSKEEIEHKYY